MFYWNETLKQYILDIWEQNNLFRSRFHAFLAIIGKYYICLIADVTQRCVRLRYKAFERKFLLLKSFMGKFSMNKLIKL